MNYNALDDDVSQAPSSSDAITSEETPAAKAWRTEHQLEARRRKEQREREHQESKRKGTKFPNLRKSELQRIFLDHWGLRLPDDDAGRGDLRLMADHLLQVSSRLFLLWAGVWAPWASEAELLDMIMAGGREWQADELGQELGLDDETRTRLKIRTIGAVDCTKEQRVQRRKDKDAAAARARRVKAGAVPRVISEARTKLWLDEGISRRTWYRREKQRGTNSSAVEGSSVEDGTNSSAILLESQLTTKRCQGAPPLGGVLARAVPALLAGEKVFDAETGSSTIESLCGCAREKQQTPISLDASFNIREIEQNDLGGAQCEVFTMPQMDIGPRDLEADLAEAAANPTTLRVMTPKERHLFLHRRDVFRKLKRVYPQHRHGDDLDAVLDSVMMRPGSLAGTLNAARVMADAYKNGAHVPELATFLRRQFARAAERARAA
jgi:hypothetical protein